MSKWITTVITAFPKVIFSVFLFTLQITDVAAQWWNPFEPKTYDECILENMKGVSSDEAAKEIRYSCLKKHSKSGAVSSQVLKAAFSDGRCNFTWNGFEFQPAMQSKPGFSKVVKTHKESGVDVVLWFPKELAEGWDTQRENGFLERSKELLKRHIYSILDQCEKMVTYR